MSRVITTESWINAYLRYTANQESPEIFHLWTAIHMLSAALRRKIWLDRGFYITYPNLYIALVGPTAIVSKSTAADIGIKLFKDCITDAVVMEEKMTPWAVYDWLGAATLKTGEGCLSIYSQEMRSFLTSSYKEEVVTLLTSLYSCRNNAPYITKGGGTIDIKNVCINILGCSTPEWLMVGLSNSEMGGGFTGRFIYVYADSSPRSCPFPEETITPEWRQLGIDLAIDLCNINLISGQFEWSKKAKQFYADWYDNRKQEWKDERLFGYYNRKRETILKLAMILAIAEPGFSSFIIQDTHIKMALALLAQAEVKMACAFTGITFSESTKLNDRVLEQIRKATSKGGEIGEPELLRKNQHFCNQPELKVILDTLEAQDYIQTTKVNSRGKRYFRIK